MKFLAKCEFLCKMLLFKFQFIVTLYFLVLEKLRIKNLFIKSRKIKNVIVKKKFLNTPLFNDIEKIN